jgi:Icc-related predicted phosphoesterase
MKVCCLSDLHGHLPEVPACDLLLLAGDYCRDHRDVAWYQNDFRRWIDAIAQRCKVVGVAGNHDFIFELRPDLVPEMAWMYLQDSGCEWNGLTFYGSPWQPRFCDWAFNADEPELARRWAAIPDGTDIFLLHGPPHGYGDWSVYDKKHTGSPSLTERIKAVKPRLVVAGHIHSGHGVYDIDGTTFVNASLVNEQYQPVHDIIVLEVEPAPAAREASRA